MDWISIGRVYFTIGETKYKDERSGKGIVVNYKHRVKIQSTFMIAAMILLAFSNMIGFSYEIPAKFLLLLYLMTDAFLLYRNTKEVDENNNYPLYRDRSLKEHLRMCLTGGLNIIFFFLLFMD